MITCFREAFAGYGRPVMKKAIRIILLILLALLALYFCINLFDEDLHQQIFNYDDLLSVHFDGVNGFYFLWGLGESPETDIISRKYRDTLRRLFDPGVRDEVYFRNFDIQAHRAGQSFFNRCPDAVQFPGETENNWLERLERQRDKVTAAKSNCSKLLSRYRRMMDSPVFEDFTYPDYRSPIPEVIIWLKTAKLYTAICLLNAKEGAWQSAAEDILREINFCRRAVKSARTLIVNMAAKAVMRYSLHALAELMNHPDCTPEIFTQVFSGLSPLEYDHYGSRNALIGECLSLFAAVDFARENSGEEVISGSRLLNILPVKIFLQKNRTKNYYFAWISELLEYEATPPHQWRGEQVAAVALGQGEKTREGFWWLQNPLGRVMFDIAAPSYSVVIHKSCELRTKYDLVRLLADFHCHYTPGARVEEVMTGLEAYKMLDLCSGRPYRWSSAEKVFYGVGADGRDNGGVMSSSKNEGWDVAVPVALREKTGR